MAIISKYNSYNIDDLVTAWESGWQHLEKFTDLQSHQKLEGSGDKSKSPLDRVLLAVADVLNPYVGVGKNFKVPKTLPDYTVILNLATSNNRRLYRPVECKSLLCGYQLSSLVKGETLRKSLQKVTNAFLSSDDYEQVFFKIATKNNVQKFKEHWSQQDCRWAKGEYFSVKIEPRLREIMNWLRHGLDSKAKCQEAWWNCLWLFMEPTIKTMLEIKKRINADIPLYQEQMKTLNYYISHGYPGIGVLEDDGKHKLHIILKPHTPKMILNSPFEVMSVIILVQPAFDLTQQLQNKFPKSRFIRQCRAPSCGELFYTQRKVQVVCGGSRGNKKTKCALEWQQYRNWLQILSKIPERDWDNSKRKEEFLRRSR